MLRVAADTNIYVSALIFGGPPLRLLEMALASEIQLVISQPLLEELGDVLGRKFHLSSDRLARSMAYVKACTELVSPSKTLSIVMDDPDDDRVLECAQAGLANFIVTGDKHLLRLQQVEGRRIVRVAEFLQMVDNDAAGDT